MCYVYTIYSVNAVEIVDSMNLSSSFAFGNFLEFIFYPWLAEFAGVEWWIQRANCKITQRFEDFQQSRGVAPLIPVLFKGQLYI